MESDRQKRIHRSPVLRAPCSFASGRTRELTFDGNASDTLKKESWVGQPGRSWSCGPFDTAREERGGRELRTRVQGSAGFQRNLGVLSGMENGDVLSGTPGSVSRMWGSPSY